MQDISRRRIVSTAASSAERQSARLRRRERRGRHNVQGAHSQSTAREPPTKLTAQGHVPAENRGHYRSDAFADTSSAAFAKQAAALRAAEADATALLLGRAAAFGALGLIPSRVNRSSSTHTFSFSRRATLPRYGGSMQLPASSTATTAQNSWIEIERPVEQAVLHESGSTTLRTRGSSGAVTARSLGASASPAPISLGNTATCPLAHGTGGGPGSHDFARAAEKEPDLMESSSIPGKGRRNPLKARPGSIAAPQASAPSERASGSPAPGTPYNRHHSSPGDAAPIHGTPPPNESKAYAGQSAAAAPLAVATAADRGGACDREESKASKPCSDAWAPESACTAPRGPPADDVPEAASLTLTMLQLREQLGRARGEVEQYRERAEAAEGQLCSLRARAHAAEEEVRRARARTGELMLQVGRAQQQLVALHRQEEEGARREAGRAGARVGKGGGSNGIVVGRGTGAKADDGPSLRPIKVSFSPESSATSRGGEGAGADGPNGGGDGDGDDDEEDWVQAARREVARFFELKTPKASAASAGSAAGMAAVAGSKSVGVGVGATVGQVP